LYRTLGYTTEQQGIDILMKYYPASQLLPRHRFIVQDVTRRTAARPERQRNV